LMLEERKKIFERYNKLFSSNELIRLYHYEKDRTPSYHLYPVLLDIDHLKISRSQFIDELKTLGIGASVHFIPLYRHPYYRDTFNLKSESYPVSEYLYPRIMTLPIWPGMTDQMINKVADTVNLLTIVNKK